MNETKSEVRARELLCRALIEATVNVHNKEFSECKETADCSEAHLRRMSEILGIPTARNTSARKKSGKKVLIALLIAAALLLASCAMIIYQDRIQAFFEEVFDSHLRVTFEGTLPEREGIITEFYELTYVPEGYELTGTIRSKAVNRLMWENHDGETLMFEQTCYIGTIFDVKGETTRLDVKDYDVYYRKVRFHHYVWYSGNYRFILRSSAQLPMEELEKIIKETNSFKRVSDEK